MVLGIGEHAMKEQIEKALNAKGFVDNVVVDGKTVDFDLNGVAYFAKLVRGKFVQENMRRASYY
jgi:hypothetical protein